MSYDKTSKSINDRYKRLSEENEVIKNQEESSNTTNMSEHETIQPEIISPTISESKYGYIFKFLDKYKFWITVIFILIILTVIGIKAYSHKNSTLNIIEKTLADKKMNMSKTSVIENINKILPKKMETPVITSSPQLPNMSQQITHNPITTQPPVNTQVIKPSINQIPAINTQVINPTIAQLVNKN